MNIINADKSRRGCEMTEVNGKIVQVMGPVVDVEFQKVASAYLQCVAWKSGRLSERR